MSIKAIGFEPVPVYRKPAYGKTGYGFRISNLDELNPVYFETDNLTVTSSASSPLPQQASVTFDGSKDVWMSSGVPGRIVAVDFSPSSLTYDNPVGVQIALNALGLAKDATLTGGHTLAQPAVPNMQFASQMNIGPTVGVGIVSPGVPWRLWSVWISYSALSNNSYTIGLTEFFASVIDSVSLEVFCGIELAVDEPGQLVNDTLFVDMPGIPFTSANDALLVVNAGSGPANTSQRASAGCMFSTP